MIRLLTAVLLVASFQAVAQECPGFSPLPEGAPTKCDLNQLNNNEVADADEVMDNFNKLGDAIDVLEANKSDFIYRWTRRASGVDVVVYCTDEYPIAISGTCIQPNLFSTQPAVGHRLHPVGQGDPDQITPGSYSCKFEEGYTGEAGVLCTKGNFKSWCRVQAYSTQEADPESCVFYD